MTIKLTPELEERVRQRVAAGDASTVEDYVQRVVNEAVGCDEVLSAGPSTAAGESAGNVGRDLPALEPRRRPIMDMMREIWGDLSEEEARSLPSDGAEQADHYIYGTPKRKL